MSQPTQLTPPQMPGGRLEISDAAVVSLVHEAVLSCYGVVDMAPRSLGAAFIRRLRLGSGPTGIDVTTAHEQVIVEISIVVEYGTPIFTVAQNVMQAVKFQLERSLGMPVDRVNVNVDGLRVSPNHGTAK